MQVYVVEYGFIAGAGIGEREAQDNERF